MFWQFLGKLLQLGVYPRGNCWRKWTDEKALWNLEGGKVFKEDGELGVGQVKIARQTVRYHIPNPFEVLGEYCRLGLHE